MEIVAKLLIWFTVMNHLAIGLDFKKDVAGKDCKVIEPTRNFTFNLEGLKRDLSPWLESRDSAEKFSFNLCGPLSRKCGGQTAGACMMDAKGKETVIGFSEKLSWNDGLIRFTFSDANCNKTHNFTVNVLLHCDYDIKKQDEGVFHKSCDVNFVMKSQLACLPIPDKVKNPKCVVQSPHGPVLNLNSLGNANHVATFKGAQTFSNGTKFIIGICNPVLYGHEAACEPGTSVCRFDPKGENASSQYKNLGMQTQDFSFVGDQLLLSMPSPEPCNKTTNFSSEIHFECDHDGHNNDPVFHATVDCKNIFSFATPAVCVTKKPCFVENEERKKSFDFSSLARIQYEAVNANNSLEKIKFSICSDAGDPCIEKAGSCVTKDKQSTSAGKTNSDLKLAADQKSPYLHYTDGAVCKKQGQTFSTRIDFICADNVTDEGAVAIEDGCDITIHFKTLLACDFIQDCIGKDLNGVEVDLRPLIDFDGNYIATVNDKKVPKEPENVQYLLNVCRPLNSKYSLNCRGTSGACRTEKDSNGKHENELSLGHPDYSMSVQNIGENKQVTMLYFGGSTCINDPNDVSSTRIRFFCDEKAGLGNPILDSINDCQYEFDFPTNILCRERSVDRENNTCNLYNDVLSVSVDLKLFGDDGKFKVGDTTVDICGGNDTKFYTIVYKQSMVRIEFAQKVGKDSVDVNVQLKCSASNSTTSQKADDGIFVVHEGSVICRLLKITPRASSDVPSPPKPDANHGDESSSGLALGYVFLISIVIVAFVAFYLVIRNPERREIIRNLIKFRSTSNVHYTRNVNEDDYILS